MIVMATVAALSLILVPATSYAYGGCSGRGNQAQSCAPGTAWDHTLQSCVKLATG